MTDAQEAHALPTIKLIKKDSGNHIEVVMIVFSAA